MNRSADRADEPDHLLDDLIAQAFRTAVVDLMIESLPFDVFDRGSLFFQPGCDSRCSLDITDLIVCAMHEKQGDIFGASVVREDPPLQSPADLEPLDCAQSGDLIVDHGIVVIREHAFRIAQLRFVDR